jgi:hypothetical protein
MKVFHGSTQNEVCFINPFVTYLQGHMGIQRIINQSTELSYEKDDQNEIIHGQVFPIVTGVSSAKIMTLKRKIDFI